MFVSRYLNNALTLSDTDFFGLQKHGWGFASCSRAHKNIQNYESTHASRLMASSLPYMVKSFFCLFRSYESTKAIILRKHVMKSIMTS